MSPADDQPTHVGRRLLRFDELPSTNDHAASLSVDPANAGTVVIAGSQTRGRGQYGRVWQSRPGASLLLSALVFPPAALRRPVVLTAWAAVAVADAVTEMTGAEVRIKWPNDLLVGGKKVCGILIEQGLGTVVGVGLNLDQSADEFAAAGLPEATSLRMLCGHEIDSGIALRTVTRHLDNGYARVVDNALPELEAAWQTRVGLTPYHNVAVELLDGATVTGRLLDLGFDGVAVDDGTTSVRLHKPETVRRVSAVT